MILTDEGPTEVQAKKFGPLAIHRRPGYDPDIHSDRWTVTHIQTGMALGNFEKDIAVKVAEQLQGLDWNFAHPWQAPRETRIAAEKVIESA